MSTDEVPTTIRTGICVCGCGRTGRIAGRGLVGRCYQRLWRLGNLDRYPQGQRGRPWPKKAKQ